MQFTPPICLNKNLGTGLSAIVSKMAGLWPFFFCFFVLIDPGAIRGILTRNFEYTMPSIGLGVLSATLATALCAAVGRRWLQYLFLALATPCYVAYVFLWLEFGLIISPETIMLLLETDGGETSEFISTFIGSRGAIVALGSAAWLWIAYLFLEYRKVYGYVFFRFKATRCRLLAPYIFVSLCAAFSVYGIVEACRFGELYATKDFNGMESFIGKNSRRFGHAYSDLPTSVLYSIHYVYVSRNELSEWERLNDTLGEDVACAKTDSLDVVFVIGESYIRDHAGIYGYELPTTPAMQREMDNGRLVAYTDMMSRATMTTQVLRSLLTANDNRSGRGWNRSPYVPLLFRNAGFNVWLFENQQQFGGKTSPFNTGVNVFLFNPVLLDKCYTYRNGREYRYDLGLVNELDSLSPGSGNNFYLFHLMGQHIKASARYPREGWDAPFDMEDVGKFRHEEWLDEDMLREIAEYDNATAYNDLVMGRLFDFFRDRKAVIVYVSDHGEEVYDFRAMMGRKNAPHEQEGQRAYYQNSVPFVVWWSERYGVENPEVVDALRSSADRRGVNDDIYNLLLSLGSVQTSWYDATRDIHSSQYTAPERIMLPSRLDYDELVRPDGIGK